MEDSVPPRDPLTHPASVAANVRGEIAPRQRATLRAALTRRMVIAWNGLVAGLVLFVFAPVFFDVSPWMPTLALVVAALIFIPARVLVESVRAWRALTRAAVARGDGSALWYRGTCLVALGDARLQATEPVRLLPGKYRLYYLAGTTWLLSAEALQVCSLAEALVQANNLPREARAAHVTGRLTRAEAGYLARSALSCGAGGVTVCGAWCAVLVGIMLLWSGAVSDVWPCALAEVLFLTAFFWGFFRHGPRLLWRALRLSADLRAGEVAMLTGEIVRTCRRKPYQRGLAYYYEFEGLYFEVTRLGYQVLVPEVRYRLCYAPRSRTLLSIVPVPADRCADPLQLWYEPEAEP